MMRVLASAGPSAADRSRYARQLVLPEVGPAGQERLRAARVVIVGAGGLGSPAALYLAAAGVGTLGLVDSDVVEESNLHRQLLYGVSDVGRGKLEAAAERLRDVSPELRVEAHETRLSPENALGILREYDVVLDGTDNFPARYLVNDACARLERPNVYASVYRFEGQASVFWAPRGPCYRCLHPLAPPPGSVPDCAQGGVLGVLPGLLGMIQATETLKLILGRGEPLIGRLLLVDALKMEFSEIRLDKNPACAGCGPGHWSVPLAAEAESCGEPAVVRSAAVGAPVAEISPEQLRAKLDRQESMVLVDVREPHEYAISDLAGSVKIPLATLPRDLERLSRDQEIVVYCRTGGRSGQAVQFLRAKGYEKSFNLSGGINSWAERVDPSLPRY